MKKEQFVKIFYAALGYWKTLAIKPQDRLIFDKKYLEMAILDEGVSFSEIRNSIQELLLDELTIADDVFIEAALDLVNVVGEPEKYLEILCKLILDKNHKR